MRIAKTPFPPAGWNSYDCYGVFINEAQALQNIDVFVKRLKPFGYEYFTIDACWYMDDVFTPGYSREARHLNIDAYGRFIASPRNFPHGLKHLADACHAGGVKFGVHIMRGIPRMACERNTPVKNTSVFAKDIADKAAVCTWGTFMYGVDVTKPGGQAYYDSVVEHLAENGVDFIKADDIVEYPLEIEAVAKAIDKVDRPILLSLSPGNETFTGNWDVFRRCGNMVRITRDIWDLAEHMAPGFDRWEHWEHLGGEECWLDLDMIPFGGIQVHVPENTPKEFYPVLGCRRQSWFTPAQKRTCITQRAMAASPLIYGGDLPMTPDGDFALVTNGDMLACNRNGVVGKKIFDQRHIDIRRVIEKGQPQHGWLGIFNRQALARTVTVTSREMGFEAGFPAKMRDIWADRLLAPSGDTLSCHLEVDDVLFVRY